MKKSIRFYGDPILRERAQPIDQADEHIRQLADDMIETMHAEGGIGLAAQQIGEALPLCVIDLPVEMDEDETGQPANADVQMPMILLNPEITASGTRKWTREEGCLSFPEVMGRIERPWTISLRYTAMDGSTHERDFHGMLARVIQHEVDHLNGVLFIDHMSYAKRLALKGRLRRLKESTVSNLAN